MAFIMPNLAKRFNSGLIQIFTAAKANDKPQHSGLFFGIGLNFLTSFHRLRLKYLPLCYVLLLSLTACSPLSHTNDFAAKVRYAELIETPEAYTVTAEIKYLLSPTAKEALHKGIPLAWDILIEIHQSGLVFNSTIYQKKLPYSLQFHALLNQYEVKTPGQIEMFLTLNSAINFMAMIHDAVHIDKALLKVGQHYELAVKTVFNREFLPIPLRPVAYLDDQWFLSSDWLIWPIQK
jgi:hypothetical protein